MFCPFKYIWVGGSNCQGQCLEELGGHEQSCQITPTREYNVNSTDNVNSV